MCHREIYNSGNDGGFFDFCSIWPMGGPKVVQRTPTGLTKLLPTRPADSETFCFLTLSNMWTYM